MKQFLRKYFPRFLICHFIVITYLLAQTHIASDPFYLLLNEKSQFEGRLPMQSNVFRPIFFNTDSTSISFTLKSEGYYNDNAPNQENMDVRYFSKGVGIFNSVQIAYNSPYFSFIAEPYMMQNKSFLVNEIHRSKVFSVLNDQPLKSPQKNGTNGFRNLLAFIHYKGIGFGWHEGNRWWGPGIHTSLQMTNNTMPIPAQIIGTIQEIRIGSFGFYGLYTFAKMNKEIGHKAKYFTILNGQITWYGFINLSLGFSRNYLSGGVISSGYEWSESDARKIIFEGIFTSNLASKEYTDVRGGDPWDQTLSGYLTITLPDRDFKLYAEFGVNDNRMYYADFLSQPDHTLATVIGFRDYGVGKSKNWLYGFEWSNLMVTYTIRHRGLGGTPVWYSRSLYDYNTYMGRRWAAHSGGDSDDWYVYAGYLSDKLMVVPALNYERHGIVTHRPAEVKMEFRLDTRYKYRDIWFGIYYENQFEAFLGFPDYFYENDQGQPIDASEGHLANSRQTNTLILSLSKTINY